MATEGHSYLVVEVEGEQFGFDLGRVKTVVEHRDLAPIPGCPSPFLGALNHHGELLPVVPLAGLLGRKPGLDRTLAVIVVLTWEDALLGLLVERAQGLLTPLDTVRPAHVLGKWDGPYLRHTLETEGRRVHVLDLDSMLADLGRRL